MDEVTRQDGSPNAEGARSIEGEQADEIAAVLPRIGDLVGGVTIEVTLDSELAAMLQLGGGAFGSHPRKCKATRDLLTLLS